MAGEKAQIGGYQFRYIEGDFPNVELKSDLFTRPGYSGFGIHDDAIRGNQTTVIGAAAFASNALRDVGAGQAQMLPALGLVTAYDNDGNVRYYLKVSNIRLHFANGAGDTEGLNYHLYVTMDLTSLATGY